MDSQQVRCSDGLSRAALVRVKENVGRGVDTRRGALTYSNRSPAPEGAAFPSKSFRTRARGNNPGMTDLMLATPEEDIAALAQYMAGLQYLPGQ